MPTVAGAAARGFDGASRSGSASVNDEATKTIEQPSHSAKLASLARMKVSELSRRSGVSPHRIRHYESLGLIQADRSDAGYRYFAERTVREVIFIAMSRDLGFSLKEIGDFVPRYRAGTLTFDQMIDGSGGRIAEVDKQIAVLGETRRKLVEHVDWLEQRKREYQARQAAPKAGAAWGRPAASKARAKR